MMDRYLLRYDLEKILYRNAKFPQYRLLVGESWCIHGGMNDGVIAAYQYLGWIS